MNHPSYSSKGGAGIMNNNSKHSHAYLWPLSLNRQGIRLQCWCGRHIIYTPYIEIELPRKETYIDK